MTGWTSAASTRIGELPVLVQMLGVETLSLLPKRHGNRHDLSRQRDAREISVPWYGCR
jgi:hypothetical protein